MHGADAPAHGGKRSTNAVSEASRPEAPTASSTIVVHFVDQAGCSEAEFCAAITIAKKSERKLCAKAAWKNDEPIMTAKTADCAYDKKTKSWTAKL